MGDVPPGPAKSSPPPLRRRRSGKIYADDAPRAPAKVCQKYFARQSEQVNTVMDTQQYIVSAFNVLESIRAETSIDSVMVDVNKAKELLERVVAAASDVPIGGDGMVYCGPSLETLLKVAQEEGDTTDDDELVIPPSFYDTFIVPENLEGDSDATEVLEFELDELDQVLAVEPKPKPVCHFTVPAFTYAEDDDEPKPLPRPVPASRRHQLQKKKKQCPLFCERSKKRLRRK